MDLKESRRTHRTGMFANSLRFPLLTTAGHCWLGQSQQRQVVLFTPISCWRHGRNIMMCRNRMWRIVYHHLIFAFRFHRAGVG